MQSPVAKRVTTMERVSSSDSIKALLKGISLNLIRLINANLRSGRVYVY